MNDSQPHPTVSFYSSPDEKQEAGQSDDSDDSMSVADKDEVGGVAKPRAVDRYGIFITRLPTNMSERTLFDTLWDVFSTVGRIKVIKNETSIKRTSSSGVAFLD